MGHGSAVCSARAAQYGYGHPEPLWGKGYSPPVSGIGTRLLSTSCLRGNRQAVPDRDDAQPSIIERPAAVAIALGAELLSDGAPDFFLTLGWHAGDNAPSEKREPVFHPVLAFDASGAIEELRAAHFETVALEQRRVFSDGGIKPGELDRPQHLANRVHDGLDVAVPA